MKKSMLAVPLLAAALLAGFAGAAGAQVLGSPVQPVQKPLSIKLGVFIPTNSDGRNSAGSTQISAGADYAILKTSGNSPSIPSVYFDYQGGTKNGGHTNTYALGVAIRNSTSSLLGDDSKGFAPYFGLGIGAYHVDARRDSSSDSDSKTGLGGKVFAGLEFNGGVFVEANYQIVPDVAGVNPSGIGVQIGDRF